MLDTLENHGFIVPYKLVILDVAKCAPISFSFQPYFVLGISKNFLNIFVLFNVLFFCFVNVFNLS
jgi:hypothetical protein